ncbi:MAG TPA: TadE family type IV pilus minor pilin [Intrasporangium sp.]|uniref:TadE family type IV pilus minor pilin n=1 Tax=Intrasporangium sp. TaxID=1925024 RepID=UPI002D79016D|nr:TadE family type IV pilus minor pilin [Intrasporangium sp.]HET7398706.1 TadE family type IV pilus minor pilin [Intrasporangium sp.]
MVTAELAVALPGLVLMLALCLAGLVAAADQLRCLDAARLASRAAARGDAPAVVRGLALRAAPPGASVAVNRRGHDAHVEVRAVTGGWGGVVPLWRLGAEASTPVEDGVATP